MCRDEWSRINPLISSHSLWHQKGLAYLASPFAFCNENPSYGSGDVTSHDLVLNKRLNLGIRFSVLAQPSDPLCGCAQEMMLGIFSLGDQQS